MTRLTLFNYVVLKVRICAKCKPMLLELAFRSANQFIANRSFIAHSCFVPHTQLCRLGK